jgi:immunoglobulin-binding protein 1
MTTNLPLPQYYAQTLDHLLPIFEDAIPLSSPDAQMLLTTSLDNLYLISRMITTLGVFSSNEAVEELGDGELGFVTLGWVLGEAESKGGLGGHGERIQALKRSEVGS